MKIKFQKGRVGSNAYKVSKVWKIGAHVFMNGGDFIARLCYLRTETCTHYIQVSVNFDEKFMKGEIKGIER